MKKSKLVEQLKYIRQAAIKSGIWKYTFLGYGSMLGAVREKGIIGHDPDADICILADKIEHPQENLFYKYLWDYKLFAHRHKERRRHDTGRLLWCSLKKFKNGMKTCLWFQQRWNGFYWHAKGKVWVSKIGRRLNPPIPGTYDSVGKGIPEDYFDGLTEIDWYHVPWKVPTSYGKCLDFYYPNWSVPKKGCASESPYLWVVPKWKFPKKWFIRRR
jgi:hypothetical protein